ncbi:hypothetical protein Noda2021_12290 [Candidatus Dependentiae bacterium Noda2021]|nr:hypothetical protein Noda2021_12290 [Candidatus Dependentiae bacterium Noda2021]
MTKNAVFGIISGLCLLQAECMEINESPALKKQIVYFRPQLGYLYSQSEFLIFLAKENFDSPLHKPPHSSSNPLSIQTKRQQHNESILFEFKRALARKADIMAVDKNCNSLMHLVLQNSWAPSRGLIKILIPATLWLEANTEGKCAFDYLEPHDKHAECADLIIHDVMRFICKKKKINFKKIISRYTKDEQFRMLKLYFAKMYCIRSALVRNNRKTY